MLAPLPYFLGVAHVESLEEEAGGILQEPTGFRTPESAAMTLLAPETGNPSTSATLKNSSNFYTNSHHNSK